MGSYGLARQCGRLAAVAALSLLASCTALGAAGSGPAPHYATTVTSSGPINAAAIPLGDGYLSTTPKVGYVDSCPRRSRPTGGASVRRPVDQHEEQDVELDREDPRAGLGEVAVGLLQGHGLGHPADRQDQRAPDQPHDGNVPDRVERSGLRLRPQPELDHGAVGHLVAAAGPRRRLAKPTCTSLGAIGVLNDGVLLFNALDGEGRDAVAHELLDSCDDHPMQSGTLHHHDVPSCIVRAAKGRSTLVGYAVDGYGIYVERNAKGQLLTNTDLDACHGRVVEGALEREAAGASSTTTRRSSIRTRSDASRAGASPPTHSCSDPVPRLSGASLADATDLGVGGELRQRPDDEARRAEAFVPARALEPQIDGRPRRSPVGSRVDGGQPDALGALGQLQRRLLVFEPEDRALVVQHRVLHGLGQVVPAEARVPVDGARVAILLRRARSRPTRRAR